MDSKGEKENRKQLKKSYIEKIKQTKESNMPMSKTDLKQLFEYLDGKLEEEGCRHNLILTKAFLTKKQIPLEAIIPWLNQYGGYYDCEVLANVEGEFEEII